VDVARDGFSYTCRRSLPGLFAEAEPAAAADAPRRPFVHGTALAVSYPVRRLDLSVEFPRGRPPEGLRGYAWPRALVPEEDQPDLSGFLYPAGRPVRGRGQRGCVRLSVPWPLVEIQYGLGWDRW